MNTRKFASAALVLAAAVVLAVAAPALADKGGSKGGGTSSGSTGGGGGGGTVTTQTSSIALATVNGAAGAQPTLNSTVTFSTVVAGLSGSEYPVVVVSCYQGTTQVYGGMGTPTDSFLLGGGSSLWLVLGGSATCNAELFAYGWKGGVETVRSLATTGNWTAAG